MAETSGSLEATVAAAVKTLGGGPHTVLKGPIALMWQQKCGQNESVSVMLFVLQLRDFLVEELKELTARWNTDKVYLKALSRSWAHYREESGRGFDDFDRFFSSGFLSQCFDFSQQGFFLSFSFVRLKFQSL